MDTNVLVYAVNQRAPEYERCRSLLERWRTQSGAWFLTWGVCHEFLRVVTHRRYSAAPLSSDQAFTALQAILRSPSLQMLGAGERYGAVLADIVRETPGIAGDLWHDVETAALMREHGIRRIVTRDTHFHRFRFLEVIDPLVDTGM